VAPRQAVLSLERHPLFGHHRPHRQAGTRDIDQIDAVLGDAKTCGKPATQAFGAAKGLEQLHVSLPLDGDVPVTRRTGASACPTADEHGQLKLGLVSQEATQQVDFTGGGFRVRYAFPHLLPLALSGKTPMQTQSATQIQ
jgi:hypothetical protein